MCSSLFAYVAFLRKTGVHFSGKCSSQRLSAALVGWLQHRRAALGPELLEAREEKRLLRLQRQCDSIAAPAPGVVRHGSHPKKNPRGRRSRGSGPSVLATRKPK